MNPYSRNGILWIQGIEGARAYPLVPNSNVILMDSEAEKFYIKTCDNIGMCNLRTFTYKEEIPTQKEYVTKDELIELLRSMKDEQTISRDEPSADEPTDAEHN